jgi:hypothetical protein
MMRFTDPDRMVTRLDDMFQCRPRRKKLTLEKCLDDYLESNAFDRRLSACYRCPMGRGNRENCAGGAPGGP